MSLGKWGETRAEGGETTQTDAGRTCKLHTGGRIQFIANSISE